MSASPLSPKPPSSALRRLSVVALQGGAAVLCLILLLAITLWALGVSPKEGLGRIWEGAIGSHEDGYWYPLSETLIKTIPLLLTGLGVAVAWRAGLFSIGGEGQLTVSIIAATAIAKLGGKLPGGVLFCALFLGGTLAGALWGALAGWLRVRRNVQEVISTIMMNYIALQALAWVVEGPLQEASHVKPQSDPIPSRALLPRLFPASLTDGIQTRLHLGIFLALLTALAVYLYLFRTPSGFAMRLMGQNPEAARLARVNIDRLRLKAMFLSGALCGMAGVIELLGITGRLYPNFSPGWGYTAIPVALLGGLHPFGITVSALFFGGLSSGTGNLSRFSGVSSVLVYIIQGAAVLAIVGARAWKNRHSGSETD